MSPKDGGLELSFLDTYAGMSSDFGFYTVIVFPQMKSFFYISGCVVLFFTLGILTMYPKFVVATHIPF